MSWQERAVRIAGDEMICSPRIIRSGSLLADPADLGVGSDLGCSAFVVSVIVGSFPVSALLLSC
jgi:hypothetical protein